MKTKFLPFEILYEDAELIVIDKPAGLLTTSTRLSGRAARASQLTAENLLNNYVRKGQLKSTRRVWLVHRLDRDTSGVMMFAKNGAIAEAYRSDWNGLTEKTYLALIEGRLEKESGTFQSYLLEDPRTMKVSSVASGAGGKKAVTQWRRLSDFRGGTLVEVKLKSGRKNQIRVHFSEAGHPVVGDVKYGAKKAERLFLHSWKLAFFKPGGNEKFEFETKGTMW